VGRKEHLNRENGSSRPFDQAAPIVNRGALRRNYSIGTIHAKVRAVLLLIANRWSLKRQLQEIITD
jgi:hypothetical protein